jgi:putative oligomerization/nucleic acid binding protein
VRAEVDVADLKKWGKAAAKGGVIGVAVQARRDKRELHEAAAPDAVEASEAVVAAASPDPRAEARSAGEFDKANAKQSRADAKSAYVPLARRATVKAGNMIPGFMDPNGLILDVERSRLITKKAIYPLSSKTTINVVSGGDVAVRSTGLLGWGSESYDNRTLILQAEDPELGWALTLPAKPTDEVKTRAFAQKVALTVAALAPAAEGASVSAAEEPPAVGAADELAKLAKLLESGVLTEDEFKAAKARLLGL